MACTRQRAVVDQSRESPDHRGATSGWPVANFHSTLIRSLCYPIARVNATVTVMGEMIQIEGTDVSAYLSRPEGAVRGGLIVIHEIWGLVDHIKEVADRFSREGYLVVAPDLLSKVGIEPYVGLELLQRRFSDDPEVRASAQPALRDAMAPIQAPEYGEYAVSSLRACVDFLEQQPGVDGRIAVTGFCFGGSYSFALAAADSRVRAAAPFYGAPPQLDKVADIGCAVHAFYGRNDPTLMESLPSVEQAMSDAGVDYEITIYEQTGHAFFNDTNPIVYDADAAADAQAKLFAFLDKNLS